jgi:phage/plasmid-associated DNA primase
MDVMPFRVTVPDAEQDHSLETKLKDELPGIFLWAVEGKRRLQQQDDFTKSTVCAEAKAEYRLDSSPARRFLTECCEASPESIVHCDDLFAAFKAWCKSTGNEALTDSAFGKEARKHFPEAVRNRESSGKPRRWFYRGIQLLASTGESDDSSETEFLTSVGVKAWGGPLLGAFPSHVPCVPCVSSGVRFREYA